jgi:hypothetical protein
LSQESRPYLRPYLDAVRQHGSRFPALLWASPDSQAARFRAITRAYDLHGKSLADVGCGRADLLDFLHKSRIEIDHYVGIEAVDALADAAELKGRPNCTILRADFVKEPIRMFVGADVVLFSGSLNTLSKDDFCQTVRRAWDAAAEAVVFNFLSSPRLAAAKYLTWHAPEDVTRLLDSLGGKHVLLTDYLDGDATAAVWRTSDAR